MRSHIAPSNQIVRLGLAAIVAMTTFVAFAKACNMPINELDVTDPLNRFYVYGVIARLATLSAAKESLIALQIKD